MFTRRWTYSTHKPLNKFNGTATSKEHDKLFDKIVNSASDVTNAERHSSPPNIQMKKKAKKKNRKRLRNPKQTLKEIKSGMPVTHDTSVHLFQDENQYRKGRKTQEKFRHCKLNRLASGMQLKRKIANTQMSKPSAECQNSWGKTASQDEDGSFNLIVEAPQAKHSARTYKQLLTAADGWVTFPKSDCSGSKVGGKSQRKERNDTAHNQEDSFPRDDRLSPTIDASRLFSVDIEQARDVNEILLQRPIGITRSPLSPLVPSDEDSPVSIKKTKKARSSELGWVTISSNLSSFRTERENSERTSQYTYTYVSTYSDSTTPGTVSTKTTLSSPPVKMKHAPLPLNSTNRMDKDNIGDVEFPDSLSPIFASQNESTQQTERTNSNSALRMHNGKSVKKTKHPPKCSTVLFMSESPSRLHLGSKTLSTIHGSENTMDHTSGTMRGRSASLEDKTTACDQPTDIRAKKSAQNTSQNERSQHNIKASTPQAGFEVISFSLSPIAPPSFDDDELHPHESIEVNSDEIIVPSLMEPTVLAGDPKFNSVIMADADEDKLCGMKQVVCETNTEDNAMPFINKPSGNSAPQDDIMNEGTGKLKRDDSSMDINGNPQTKKIKETSGRCIQTRQRSSHQTLQKGPMDSQNSLDSSTTHNSQKRTCDEIDIPLCTCSALKDKLHSETVQVRDQFAPSRKYYVENMNRLKRSDAKERHQHALIMQSKKLVEEQQEDSATGSHIGVSGSEHLHKNPYSELQKDGWANTPICFINKLCMQSQLQMRQKNNVGT